MLVDRSLVWLFFERLLPAADSDICTYPQPNCGWSLRTLMEEKEEGSQPKWIETPLEDQQNQLTWTFGILTD